LGYGDIAELLDAGILSSILKINEIASENNVKNPFMYHCLVETLRTLSEVDEVVVRLACSGTLHVLQIGMELCSDQSTTIYSIVVLLYRFASTNMMSRQNVACSETAQILISVYSMPKVCFFLL
jgi:hypothetical protein